MTSILDRYRSREKLEGIKPITVQRDGVEYTLHPTVNKVLFWNRVAKGWSPDKAASTPKIQPTRPDSDFANYHRASWERRLDRLRK